jgi:hypothetical protein
MREVVVDTSVLIATDKLGIQHLLISDELLGSLRRQP